MLNYSHRSIHQIAANCICKGCSSISSNSRMNWRSILCRQGLVKLTSANYILFVLIFGAIMPIENNPVDLYRDQNDKLRRPRPGASPYFPTARQEWEFSRTGVSKEQFLDMSRATWKHIENSAQPKLSPRLPTSDLDLIEKLQQLKKKCAEDKFKNPRLSNIKDRAYGSLSSWADLTDSDMPNFRHFPIIHPHTSQIDDHSFSSTSHSGEKGGDPRFTSDLILQTESCEARPIKQRLHARRCLSRTIENRACVGQCNSFFIPHAASRGNTVPQFVSSPGCAPVEHEKMKVFLSCPKRRSRRYVKRKVIKVKRCGCSSQWDVYHQPYDLSLPPR